MQQFHLFISGDVQGVGFRYFIRSKAKKHQVTGWVRNLAGGKVEAVLQGDRENIEKIIHASWEGPFLAKVIDIEVSEEEITEIYEKLETRPTI